MIASTGKKQQIIAVVGPTAVGKTSLSIELAKAVNGEVVSADSRQVYQGLDIGSGKVMANEMDGVPHHLLDVADPKEVFSAADYVRLGREAIEGILGRGKVPIVVGGTGFYIDALIGAVSLADVPEDPVLRSMLRSKSIEELQMMLQEIDPDRFETIDSQNPVRLVRAIEIATALGKNPHPTEDILYDVLWIGLTLPQEELYKNIENRLIARLENGMLEEVKTLHQNDLSYERMEELGLEYRYMARHLRGDISYEEMYEQLEIETRKYAKRQMTWFRKNDAIQWMEPKDVEKAIELAEEFLG